MFHNTLIIFFGIFIEAFPFMIIGVVISSLITVFVSPEFIARFFPEGAVRSLLVALVAGFAFPVCECGNIPVARGLLAKGVAPAPVITFLLAAPVFNPIAITSTAIAFPGHPEITWLRVLLTGIIAFTVGALFLPAKMMDVCRDEEVFRDYIEAGEVLEIRREEKAYRPLREGGDRSRHGRDIRQGARDKVAVALMLARDEFFYVSRFLVLGALVAALFRTVVPVSAVTGLGQGPVVSILVMMLLAFVISMCSNVDAFFAMAFTDSFTNGSLLAFLVFGPMIDIKAVSMLYSTFKTGAIALMVLVVFLMTFMFSLAVNYFVL